MAELGQQPDKQRQRTVQRWQKGECSSRPCPSSRSQLWFRAGRALLKHADATAPCRRSSDSEARKSSRTHSLPYR